VYLYGTFLGGLRQFIDNIKCEIPVRDATKINKVVGIGPSLHKFTDIRGILVYLPCVLYHLPETDVHLFPPQTYHQMHGEYLEVYCNCVRMLFKTLTINIRIVREEHNLPIVFDSFVSGKSKKELSSNMPSGLCHTRLNALDFFHDNHLGNLGHSSQFSTLDLEHCLNFGGACVGATANDNVSVTQKELLKWHRKLGIGMYCIQEMIREHHYKELNETMTILPTIIKPKNPSARNCIVPPCR
jgi:hypothetical protein